MDIDICLGPYLIIYFVVFDRVAGRVFIWTALKKKEIRVPNYREEARKMDRKPFSFQQYMDRI